MSTPLAPLDPRELAELERLEALAADGPIEEAQRARLDELRARCEVPHAMARLHRELASAYRELRRRETLEHTCAESADDAAFLRALQQRIASGAKTEPAPATAAELVPAQVTRKARPRFTLLRLSAAAAVLGAAAAGAWWLVQRGENDGAKSGANGIAQAEPQAPRDEVREEVPEEAQPEAPIAPERMNAAREAVRTAFADVAPASDKDAFLAALDAHFAALRSEGWPLDVLVTRRIERALNAASLDEHELREVEGALRWLALRHPESSLAVIERAARDPRVQSAALKALAEAGTPRALERLAQRARREPDASPAAAQALASAGLAGVQRLIDLWRGEKETPESVRAALFADPATLDRALAERLGKARVLDRSLREIAALRGGERTRAALLERVQARGFGAAELELAIALGGSDMLEALLDHTSREHGSRRQALLDAVSRRLHFPQAVAEARAVALRFKPEDDPRAAILLEAFARLEPQALARIGLALLEVPTLEGIYRDHLLLALAGLPPNAAQDLGLLLEQQLAAAGFDAHDNAAAWAVALAGQVDLDRALRFLSSRTARERIDDVLRERLEKALLATLRAEPGLGALSALQRVQQLLHALL